MYREQGGGVRGVTEGVSVTDVEKACGLIICPY